LINQNLLIVKFAKRVLFMGKKINTAARGAGSFLGGIANNPGIVIIGLVLGGLFIFKDKIAEGLGGLGESLAGGLGDISITLPEIKLPEFNFPEFKFPELPPAPDFSGLFESFQQQQNTFLSGLTNLFGGGFNIPQPQKMVEDTGLLPDPNICECGSSIVQDAFGNVNQQCKPCAAGTPAGTPAVQFNDAAIFAKDFPETFVYFLIKP